MRCPNCQSETTGVTITKQGTFCHKCMGVAETSGVRLDNIATRNSFRIRQEQQKYESDMIPPHRYNKETRRKEPNPDFINLYSDKAHVHYTPDELREAKFDKLANKVQSKLKEPSQTNDGVKYKGSTKKGIRRAINNAK